MSVADANRTILTGENPFIRLSAKDGDPNSTDASYWRILLSPAGRRLDQELVRELAAEPRITLICGRYEGVDERVVEGLPAEEISIGDYVLSGGDGSPRDVTEQDIIDLEREATLKLLGTTETQARIKYMLETGKPLRN